MPGAPADNAQLASIIDAQLDDLLRVISECESTASAVPTAGRGVWIGSASAAYSRGLEDLVLSFVHAHIQLESTRIHLERAFNTVVARVG
jgi:hypothetical protein